MEDLSFSFHKPRKKNIRSKLLLLESVFSELYISLTSVIIRIGVMLTDSEKCFWLLTDSMKNVQNRSHKNVQNRSHMKYQSLYRSGSYIVTRFKKKNPETQELEGSMTGKRSC